MKSTNNINNFYEVGRVLKPYDGIGYSVIISIDSEKCQVLTDFGNIIGFSLDELYEIELCGCYEYRGEYYSDNVENPLKRLYHQINLLEHAKLKLIDMGFNEE